jgi:ribonuclease P protein component
MPKSTRLSRDEMTAFYKGRSSRIRGAFLDLAFMPAKQTKIACVVSKKTLPHAVDRNRVRRRVRAAFSSVPGLPSPLTLVFTARPGADKASFDSLSRDVRSLVEKASVSYNGRI